MPVPSQTHMIRPTDDPPAAHALARAVATALVVTALSLCAVLLLAVRPDWWRGFAAASIVSLVAACASVPVVSWGMRFGLRQPGIVTGTYLAAAFVRALITLGGAVAAIALGGYPKAPTLLMVVPYYLSILAAETFVVARLLLKSEADSGSSLAARRPSPQAPAETIHA